MNQLICRYCGKRAVEAELSMQICTFEDMAMMVEATLPKAAKRGLYKKTA